MTTLTYPKTIGGDFIPKDPKRLLLERKVDPRVKILSSYSSNEGVRLAPANITNDADFTQYAGLLLNSANTSVLQHVTDILYPPVFNDSMPYTTQQTRADLFWTELVSICNPRYLHQAVKGPGYAIEYSVVPALHLADTPSIFWNGPGSDPTVNETVAELMQGYITKFVTTGNPNSKGKPVIDVYDGKHVLDMGDVRVGVARDVTDNPRCEYWHSAPYAS